MRVPPRPAGVLYVPEALVVHYEGQSSGQSRLVEPICFTRAKCYTGPSTMACGGEVLRRLLPDSGAAVARGKRHGCRGTTPRRSASPSTVFEHRIARLVSMGDRAKEPRC